MRSMTFDRGVFARAALAAGVLLSPAMADAVTVLISNPDGALLGSKVLDNYVLVGVVGDYVDFNPGDHELRIDAPRAYTLVVTVRVDGSAVSITQARTEPGNCQPNFETTWPTPTIGSQGSKASKAKKAKKAPNNEAAELAPAVFPPVATLLVTAPQFGKARGQGSCTLFSMLGCTKKFTIVAVDSIPQGGEVWVDKVRTNLKTKGTVSIPFCPGREKTKPILVRMPGRVTCPREVPMEEGVRTEVLCELALPK